MSSEDKMVDLFYASLHSPLIKANCMHWFHSGFEKKTWLVMKSLKKMLKVSITQKKKEARLRRCDSPVPDLFHLIRNSWGYYEPNIRGCHSSTPSAQCTNTKWSHCNYSFHAWEGSFSEVSWRAQRKKKKEKKNKVVNDMRRIENILLFQAKTPLSQNQSISIGINVIMTAINSRGSLSYAN